MGQTRVGRVDQEVVLKYSKIVEEGGESVQWMQVADYSERGNLFAANV